MSHSPKGSFSTPLGITTGQCLNGEVKRKTDVQKDVENDTTCGMSKWAKDKAAATKKR